MRLFTTKDGQQFAARSARELVIQLHKSSLSPSPDEETWMREAAARARTQTGYAVRSDHPDHFIADLKAIGLLREETLQ